MAWPHRPRTSLTAHSMSKFPIKKGVALSLALIAVAAAAALEPGTTAKPFRAGSRAQICATHPIEQEHV